MFTYLMLDNFNAVKRMKIVHASSTNQILLNDRHHNA